jgi:hypothetical protein
VLDVDVLGSDRGTMIKQIVVFVLSGAVSFVLAAVFSVGLYWFAPIVPCEVKEAHRTTWGGYSYRTHDDMCTGQAVHKYEYPDLHRETRQARGVHAVLAISSLASGFLGGALALWVMGFIRKSKAGAAPVAPLAPA